MHFIQLNIVKWSKSIVCNEWFKKMQAIYFLVILDIKKLYILIYKISEIPIFT